MTGDRHVSARLWMALVALAVLTLIAEAFIDRHAAFGLDGVYGFFGWFTLAVAIAAVGIARVLDRLLRRGEPSRKEPGRKEPSCMETGR